MQRSVNKRIVWIVIAFFVVAIPFVVMMLVGLTPSASWPTVSGGMVKDRNGLFALKNDYGFLLRESSER